MNGPTPRNPLWQSPEWRLIEKEIGTFDDTQDVLGYFARMAFMAGDAYSLRMMQDTVLKPFGELMQQVQERVKNL